MNNVKKSFSIRDLENLSGIKAHTIRIWEKRYNLLTPERTATNIRTYSLSSLQKLLNITLLYNNGFKISKIAKIPEANIPLIVKDIVAENSVNNFAISSFKLAMINFNETLFSETYDSLLISNSFKTIFQDVFIPLLIELGLLWQTSTISPAHEHFITSLIKQKITSNTEKLQSQNNKQADKIFVPFLPENEIHEIGLLYINYEIVLRGYKSIYLGQAVPLQTLEDVMKYFDKLHFVSYFTIAPSKEKLANFISEFETLSKKHGGCKLWVLGYQTKHLSTEALPKNVNAFTSIEQLVSQL